MKKKEGMNKFQKYITIGVFVLLFFVPGIAWIFCGEVIGDDNSENRKLAEMPEFDIAEIEKYPKQIDDYYSDHAPFRKTIKDIWTVINYEVFRDSTTKDVVIGKSDSKNGNEAWLFYAMKTDSNPVASVQGVTRHSDDAVKRVSENIKNTTEQLGKSGKKFYFFVAPNKENVYREYLPDDVKIFDEKSRDEKLLDTLMVKQDNVIYAKDEIMKAKEVGQLYYKQDTHWNNLGAFYGFKALMQGIEPGFKDFEYELQYTKPQVHNRDLARFLGMKNYFVDTKAEVKYKEDSKVQIRKEGEGDAMIEISTNSNPDIAKTVMLVGDSYRGAMLPYLQKVFYKVVSINRNTYEKSSMERFDSDTVIIEAVERNTMSGGSFKLI